MVNRPYTAAGVYERVDAWSLLTRGLKLTFVPRAEHWHWVLLSFCLAQRSLEPLAFPAKSDEAMSTNGSRGRFSF